MASRGRYTVSHQRHYTTVSTTRVLNCVYLPSFSQSSPLYGCFSLPFYSHFSFFQSLSEDRTRRGRGKILIRKRPRHLCLGSSTNEQTLSARLCHVHIAARPFPHRYALQIVRDGRMFHFLRANPPPPKRFLIVYTSTVQNRSRISSIDLFQVQSVQIQGR